MWGFREEIHVKNVNPVKCTIAGYQFGINFGLNYMMEEYTYNRNLNISFKTVD